MNPSLQGYTAAVISSLDQAAQRSTAADLQSVAETVLANDALRAALTDTSVSGGMRRDVVTDLLSSKISAPAVRLVGHAAQVTPAQDIPSTLSALAERVRQVADGEDSPEAPLSVLGARARVGGFASCVFEGADLSQLESIEDELFTVARSIEGNPELRRALTDRDLPVRLRQGVLSDLFGSKVSAATASLLGYVVAGGRARDVVGTIDRLVDQTAQARGWRVAKVRTAKALDAAQADSLRSSLAKVAGVPVELQVTEDASLLGGIRVEVGDLLVDATAKGRLESLREHMDAEHRSYVKND